MYYKPIQDKELMPNMLMDFTNNTDTITSQVSAFSQRFKVGAILRHCGAHKQKGIEVRKVFYYLCTLLFCGISMNRDQRNRKYGNMVKKDTCHRFLQSMKMDWNRFLSLLAKEIIDKDFRPICRNDCKGEQKPFFLVADDSSYCRNRSKKVELSAKNWDHALKRYYKGFRMLTLAWTDGVSVLPVSFCNMSTCDDTKVLRGSKGLTAKEKETFGFKIRKLAKQKMNDTLLDLLDVAAAANLQARYLLCDKWFANPVTIFAIRDKGYEVICMLKNSSTYYLYKGERRKLSQIFRMCAKEERLQRKLDRKAGNDDSKGRKFLFSAAISLINKDEKPNQESKIVFVRNRNKKSEYLAILCTDNSLSEDQIVEYYCSRWGIETMFHTCKSFLRLQKSTQSLDYSEIHASTAIVMFQYAMLSWLNRQNSDEIGFGELFYQLLEEVQDTALFHAIELVLTLFVETLASEYAMPPGKLNEAMNKFLKQLPERLKTCLDLAA